MKGNLIFLLHAHLPYVLSHGRWPHGVDWLNEACAETYIPLLNLFEDLSREGYQPHVTLSLSPTVCEMLSQEEFAEGFERYLSERILASEKELRVLSTEDPLYGLAMMWLEFYTSIHRDFRDRYHRDLLSAFRGLQDSGSIELVTTCATHGYLPLLSDDGSIRLQIREAVKTHTKYFGRPPAGMWLPECAYRPEGMWQNPVTGATRRRKGIERFLEEEGIRYIFVDTHMTTGANSISYAALWNKIDTEYNVVEAGSVRSPYRVFALGGTAVRVFTRDPSTGVQVWSAQWGYPGDGAYLEFHKKSFPAGLRYWRVTDRECGLAGKELYNPDEAAKRVEEHARNFVELVERVASDYFRHTGIPAVIAAPYDAELFGHWWYEGPQWLRGVIKGLYRCGEVLPVTAGTYIEGTDPAPRVEIPEGSWGDGGDHKVWFNEQTRWIWRSIYAAESVMRRVCELSNGKRDGTTERILGQMARELLLLESSDWPFLVTTGTAKDYAEERVQKHLEDFKRLGVILERYLKEGAIGEEEEGFIATLEERDSIFPDIDVSSFEEM